jgi:hypothetical protein
MGAGRDQDADLLEVGLHLSELPELTGTETLVTVLLSLLGLGAMRTVEKFGGRAK